MHRVVHEAGSLQCQSDVVRHIRNQTFQCIPRVHLRLACSLSHPLLDLLRDDKLEEGTLLQSLQEQLVEHVFDRSDGLRPPPSQAKVLLKLLIELLERTGTEADGRLYELYAESMIGNPTAAAAAAVAGDVANGGVTSEKLEAVRYFYDTEPDLHRKAVNIIGASAALRHIVIEEQPFVLASGGATGHRTWEAGIFMSNVVLARPELVRGMRVLELGAGTGLLACVCAKLGATQVVATDIDPSGVQRLARTFAANDISSKQARGEVLAFGTDGALEEQTWDIVLATDVTYEDDMIIHLVRSFRHILQASSGRHAPRILTACTIRSDRSTELYFGECKRLGLAAVELSDYADVPQMLAVAPVEIKIIEVTLATTPD